MDQTNRTMEASSMSGLDFKIKEMAGRIRALREIEGLEPSQMAAKTGISTEEYIRCESGESDLNFAFIYRCALALNVNVTEIIEGYSPKLKSFTVTRRGQGQQIAQAHGMTYYNLAYAFQNRIAEPLFVRSAYSEEAQHKDIELTTHAGQELDIVIEGKLMVQVGEHTSEDTMQTLMDAMRAGKRPQDVLPQLAKHDPAVAQAMQIISGNAPQAVTGMIRQMAAKQGLTISSLMQRLGIK